MKKAVTKLILICLWLSPYWMTAQVTMDFKLLTTTGDCGDNVCVPLTVDGYTNIVSITGSFEWNPNILEFTGLSSVIMPGFSPISDLNQVNTDQGQLGLVWADFTGMTPHTLANGSTLLELCFDIISGPSNSSHTISMTDEPTIINVAQSGATPTDPAEDLPFTISSGAVNIEDGCSQGGLACNSLLHVSTEPFSCSAILTPDMGLEGNGYDYTVMEIVPKALNMEDLGKIIDFTVTDTSNGNSCFGKVSFEDKTPPVAVAIIGIRMGLTSQLPIGNASAKLYAEQVDNGSYDNCSAISYDPVFWRFGIEDVGVQEIEFKVCDANNNCSTTFTTVTILPCSLCPIAYDQVNISLDGQNSVPVTPDMVLYPYWDANNFTITPSSVSTADIGEVPFVVEDANGNTDTGILNVCQTKGAILSCKKTIESLQPSGIAVITIDQACADIDTSCTSKGWLSSFSNTKNDETSFLVDCDDAANPGGLVPGGYTVYLWTGNTLVDSCDNMLQVLDGARHCDGATTSLVCNSLVNVSTDPWNCSVTLHPDMLLEGGPYNYNTLTITPTVVDELNTQIEFQVYDQVNDESCFGYVTLEDKTAPVVVTKEKIELALSTSNGEIFEGIIHAADVDNGSYDGCTAVSFSPEFWTFDCSDIGSQIIELEVCDDADQDGVAGSSSNDNCNTAFVEIVVELNLDVELTCPPAVTISCTDAWDNLDLTGTATTVSGCIGVEQYLDSPSYDANGDGDLDDIYIDAAGDSFSETYNVGCTNGLIERVWSIGNVSCSQLIAVTASSTFTESDIIWPETLQEFDCEVGVVQEPELINQNCELVSASFEVHTLPICSQNSAFYKEIIEWTVINWCVYDHEDPDAGGIWTNTNIVKVIDNSAPSIETRDEHIFNCSNQNLKIGAIATDECPGVTQLKWTVTLDVNDDDSADYEWSSYVADDSPGTIWQDNDGNGVPDVLIGAGHQLDNLTRPYTTKGETLLLTIPEIPTSTNRHRLVWVVTDECGNVTSASSYFEIDSNASVDVKAPTPYCIDLSTAVLNNGEVELWASDFNIGSFDNCSAEANLRYTFAGSLPGPRCDAFYSSQTDLMWYDGTFYFFDASTAVNASSGDCPLDGESPYSNGGFNPATGQFEDYGGDIHRWLSSGNSSAKIFTIDDADVNGNLTLPIYVWDESNNRDFCLVSLRLIATECELTQSNIAWPLEEIEISSSEVNVNVSPDNLISTFGYTESEVHPQFPSCAEAISTFNDNRIPLANGTEKVLRSWTVLDWLNATTFTFDQIISISPERLFICDILPNTAPVFDDCAFGHTYEDDVEWPADISIADHRINPSELMAFSNIPSKDVAPDLINDASAYLVMHKDFLEALLPSSIVVAREWTITRPIDTNLSWMYVQKITIDISEFEGRISANTMTNRPVQGVSLADNIVTNILGIGLVNQNAILDLRYEDTAANGLTIKDLVLIQRHILGLETLNNKQIIAADIHQDQSLDGRDIVEAQKVILGIYNDLPLNNIWNFIPREGNQNIPIQIKGDYLAIKTGDVDDDAILQSMNVNYPMEGQIRYADKLMNRDQNYEISYSYDNALRGTDAYGVQLSFDIDTTKLEVVNASSEIYESVSYFVKDGKLKVNAFSHLVKSIDEEILKLEFYAKDNTTLTESFEISQDASYALHDGIELVLVSGEVENPFVDGVHEVDGQLIKVYPNPATQVLNMDLPAELEQVAIFSLYDVSGRKVMETQAQKQINIGGLTNGVYTYILQLGRNQVVDKLIIQN